MRAKSIVAGLVVVFFFSNVANAGLLQRLRARCLPPRAADQCCRQWDETECQASEREYETSTYEEYMSPVRRWTIVNKDGQLYAFNEETAELHKLDNDKWVHVASAISPHP
jgi:hypothetical protein